MEAKLSKYQKYWIFKKISHFFNKDTCFKYFQSELILLDFYIHLMKSNSFENFIQRLKKSELDKSLTFPRKESVINNIKKNLKFEYPKLSFQVESLVGCWEDICLIQKKYSGENLGELLHEEIEFNSSDTDDGIELPEYARERKCFGNKPNYFVQYRPEYLDDQSISSHERNLGLPLQVDYKREYNLFNASITSRCNDVLKNKNNKVLFIQTDLQAFYHKLKLSFLINFFEKSHVLRNTKILKWIKELSITHAFEGLPIGWILSGFIANIVLLDINSRLNKEIPKRLRSSIPKGNLSAYEVEKIQLYSYVDDFIILIPMRLNGLQNSKELVKSIFKICNQIFTEQYDGTISFHEFTDDSAKCKYFVIDQHSVSKLKRNFHDMRLSVPAEVEFGFGVNELMVPHDPELVTNERNQFSIGLTAARRALARGDEIGKHNIKELLENMRNKIKSTEGKYISRVFGTLIAIIEREESEMSFVGVKPNEISKNVYACIDSIFDILISRENHPINEWASFMISFANFIFETDGDKKLLDSYFNKIKSRAVNDIKDNTLDYINIIKLEIILMGFKKDIRIRRPINEEKFNNAILNRIRENYEIVINKKSEIIKKRRTRDIIDRFSEDRKVLLNANYYKAYSKNTPREKLIKEYLADLKYHSKKGSRQIELFLSHSLYIIFEQCTNRQCEDLAISIDQLIKEKSTGVSAKFVNLFVRNMEYFKNSILMNELDRFKEQRTLYDYLNENGKLMEPIKWVFNREEIGSFYFAISYIFTCSRLNEILMFLAHGLLPIEGQQWVPWRSSILSFQIIGDKSIKLLESAYELQIGANRKEKINKEKSQGIISNLNRFILESKEEKKITPLSITYVNFEKLDKLYSNKRKELRVTIAPISYNIEKSLNKKTMDFKNDKIRKKLKMKIDAAIEEAIARKSSLLILPEMTLPSKYLDYFLRKLDQHDIILVAGLEYANDGSNAQNITVISIPVVRYVNPLGKNHILFHQVKNYPMAEEMHELYKGRLQYASNNNVYVFQTKFWSNFSVLTCSDFLSLTLRWMLQKKIQTLIVPAQNYDNSTYDVVANSCIRDLHCIAIICNNGALSKSFTYAPYYESYKRSIFEHVGITLPEFHTFTIKPEEIKFVQEKGKGDVPFRLGKQKKPNPRYSRNREKLAEFKQLPPDWNTNEEFT
ncbi:reverse transcriptase domain-containing protein [Leptospira alstonii]|uniref:RNA-directed DNA polymerase n=2 Tax=Leptospira alstonii TaxID=28452 RepID=M6CQN1_9LEPT|nr:reverse transcriptase domain-containing protein [Leptospira alstonii]EMJ91183.1 RNA-directed DNA polymerase [Leptospira alstonii serovar Sichuan str. 79601]EQA81555.1 RNA-directed DNA polymerase [Leptospira alstonii serovar Pingchang str. 80-412]